MPAAAVIPAPIAYTKVVAVKKLVVEFLVVDLGPCLTVCVPGICSHLRREQRGHLVVVLGPPSFTVSKIECSKQAYAVEYISME